MAKNKTIRSAKSADYGIDAPPVVRNLILSGIGSFAAGTIFYLVLNNIQPLVASIFFYLGIVSAVSFLFTTGMMIWSSKVGKLIQRERLIDSLSLKSNENVLDVGCGRGLLLNAVAHRLTSGKVIGIDLWQSEDLSGNRIETTLANAQAEGVADRVEIKTGDMRELQILDNTMDAVVASISIHNIPDQAGRAKAIREIARVLKPGGRVALQDFQCTKEYVLTLQDLGWKDINRSRLIFRMFPPICIVTGKKPQQ